MIKIYPSLMAADKSRLSYEIETLSFCSAGFHLDVMDSVFVPNLLWNNPQELNALIKLIKHPWIHLMVQNPEDFYAQLELPFNSLVSFHIESDVEVERFVKIIREKKQRASIAINPKTPLREIFPFLDIVDQVLVMSVDSGFSGQHFLESSFDKLSQLVEYRAKNEFSFRIGIDGGINAENIAQIARHHVDDYAVGSGIFKHNNHVGALQELQLIADGTVHKE
jgi:ribulose-phosphate 3-epimerase